MAKIELPPLVSEVDVSRVVTAHKACKDGNCSECPYQENRWGCEDNLTDDIVKYFACLMNENTELRKKVKEQEEAIEKFAKYSAELYAQGKKKGDLKCQNKTSSESWIFSELRDERSDPEDYRPE